MPEMESSVEVVVLGSGASPGIPMIGCDCQVCTSSDPHDRRYRPSILVRMDGLTILVDTAPELRLQCVANGIDRVDAVLFTHHHADHVVGLDDLRRFNFLMRGPVPLFATEKTVRSVEQMFVYAFDTDIHYPSNKPQLEWRLIDSEPFDIAGRKIIPIPMMHGPLPVLGFRFGDFAYCTDCSHIPEESLAKLTGLDVLILDALRLKPHTTHFNLEQAIEMAHVIGAKRTLLTHLTHEIMHEKVSANLPAGIELAYDGLRIRV